MTTMQEQMEANRLTAPEPVLPEVGELATATVQEMLNDLKADNGRVFGRAKDYLDGKQLAPFAPQDRTAQIRDMQKRAISNLMPLLVGLPAQVSFVDGYRRGTDEGVESGKEASKKKRFSPEYREWQRCNMDAKQSIAYRAALTYGHAFVLVDTVDKREGDDLELRILPTRKTIAYFDDPTNDLQPAVVIQVKKEADARTRRDGLILAWDELYRYEFTVSADDAKITRKLPPVLHGFDRCPVVRYTCYIDDEGATQGVVVPSIQLQNRVNQATFSTDVTANFGAFKVRWAAGLTPSFKVDKDGELVLVNGQPVPEPIAISQAKLLMSDDPTTKFGQLDETPLDGYLKAEEMAIRNFAALNQFPPHILLGNISNLSAEALDAAEAQLTRFIKFLHESWSASHEALFRLIAEAIGDSDGAQAFGGEVRWRKVGKDAFPAVVDALGKLVQMVGVPKRGAWAMIPDVTSGTLEDWEQLADDEAEEEREGMQADIQTAAAREYRPEPVRARVNVDSAATTRSAADGRANV